MTPPKKSKKNSAGKAKPSTLGPSKKPTAEARHVKAEIVGENEEVRNEDDVQPLDEPTPIESLDDLVVEKPSRLPAKKESHLPSLERSVSTTDPVALYLQEIRKYPLLSREQESELAKKYFETKDPAIAQQLVTANLRFVVKVAADYSKFGAKMIDLIQEGNMGLMHAVRDFNPYKGVRLITYAVWWIRGYIQEYMLKQYSMVKIATTFNQKKLFYRLQKEKDALDAMGETPDSKTISERLGIPVEEVEQMQQRMSGRDLSLDSPLDDDSPSSLMDLQKGDTTDIVEQLEKNEQLSILKDKLEELKPHLSEREKIILEERLLSDEPLTLQEIGEKYGITREAVRQMETRVMKKIKDKVQPES